jgi:hypothetical protein
MSLQDISSAPIEPWSNFYINSINSNQITTGTINSGSVVLTGPFNITESTPSTITGDVGSFNPYLRIPTSNTSTNYINGGVSVSGNGGQIKLYSENNPAALSGLLSDTTNGIEISTFNSADISLSLGNNKALNVHLSSPGVTLCSVQNLLLTAATSTIPLYMPSPLNYFEQTIVSIVFSGPWAVNYTRNVKITRIGNSVTLKIDGINQVSNSNSFIFATNAIPVRFVPTPSTDSPLSALDFAIIINNGNFTPVGSSSGYLSISPAGIISIYPSAVSGTSINYPANAFKSGFNCGFNDIAISYSV